MKALAILTVRNEAAFLLEWVAHHLTTGFTDILAFSNDCSDGTDRMLDRLAEMGLLTHIRNDGPHAEGPQWAALKRADKHPLRKKADWIMVVDIDEFVNIHADDHTLAVDVRDGQREPLRQAQPPGIDREETRATPVILHGPQQIGRAHV